MSWITVAWSMAAAVCLTLMAIHLLIGIRQGSRAHLLFAVTALAAAAMAVGEYLIMRSDRVESYIVLLRWWHVPTWILVVSLVFFVRAYLQAGNLWLAGAAIGVRTVGLALNFLLWPNLNYSSIRAIVPVRFWGETIFVADGAPSPWVRVGQLSSLLLLAFLVDATRAAWKRGDRRRALTVGGSSILCVLLAAGHFALVNEGVIRSPFLVSVAFLGIVAAMSYELTSDVIRTSELSVKLQATDAALRESEQRMSLAVEAGQVGLWAWDIGRDEVWTTEETRSPFGISAPERPGLERFLSSIHTDDRERVRAAVAETLADRGEFDSEYRVVGPGREIRWIAARGRVESNGDGRPVRMRGVSIDVTPRRQAELEVERQRNQLAHLSRVTMLGEMSGSLAHELNQPLMAILSNAEAAQNLLAREKADLEEVRAILADIVEDDKLAGGIIRRLRLLHRKDEVPRRALDSNELVRDALRLLRGDLLNQGVAVALRLGRDLPAVFGDPVQIQQVLMNLVANGCDAMGPTPPGERLLEVISSREEGGGVRISVADRGTGLPLEQPERVFEPFFTTKPKGLGLGLAICRTIVTTHGGRLWGESNAGRGATFHFTLPPAPPEAS